MHREHTILVRRVYFNEFLPVFVKGDCVASIEFNKTYYQAIMNLIPTNLSNKKAKDIIFRIKVNFEERALLQLDKSHLEKIFYRKKLI